MALNKRQMPPGNISNRISVGPFQVSGMSILVHEHDLKDPMLAARNDGIAFLRRYRGWNCHV
jgi:hypothetical protein